MAVIRYFVLYFLMTISVASGASEKVITMGYKAIAKAPLIGGLQDNTGLYLDLFSLAAERIGYQLKIERLPKKRLHYKLEEGTVDFYPGSSFSQRRARYLYYLPNGLTTKEVLISLNDRPEITDMNQAKGILIAELGSSKLEWGDIYPMLSVATMGKLSLDTVIKALKLGRGDFYIADIEVVDHYLKHKGLESYDDIGIKIHHNAVNNAFIPMYMGFSRKSQLFSEVENPDFNPDNSVSIQNFTTLVEKHSVAYQFHLALEALRTEGITQSLYNEYFK